MSCSPCCSGFSSSEARWPTPNKRSDHLQRKYHRKTKVAWCAEGLKTGSFRCWSLGYTRVPSQCIIVEKQSGYLHMRVWWHTDCACSRAEGGACCCSCTLSAKR